MSNHRPIWTDNGPDICVVDDETWPCAFMRHAPRPSPDAERREALSRDAAWQSGYARGRADAARAAAPSPEPDLHDHRLFGSVQPAPDGAAGLRERIEALPVTTFNTSTPSGGDYVRRDSVLALLAEPEPTGLDAERKRSFVNFVRMWWRGPNGFPVVPAGSDAVANEDFEDMERKLAEIGIALAARLTDSGATDGE